MNLVEVDRSGDELHFGSTVVPLPDDVQADLRSSSAKRFVIGVRPEHLVQTPDGADSSVTVVEELGSDAFIHASMPHGGDEETIVVRVDGETSIERGHNISIGIGGPVHIFEAESGVRLGAPVE